MSVKQQYRVVRSNIEWEVGYVMATSEEEAIALSDEIETWSWANSEEGPDPTTAELANPPLLDATREGA